jgi:glycosyltransferase involved in cell wall biosynthesis
MVGRAAGVMGEDVLPVRIGVCICTRDRHDELRRAIESLAASSLAPVEVVVSDDGDMARTAAVLASSPIAVMHTTGPRRGLGANRNAAARAASASHVLFLDDDAEVSEAFLASAADHLASLKSDDRERTILSGGEHNCGARLYANEQGFLGFQNRVYAADEPRQTVVMNAAVFPLHIVREIKFDEQLVYGYDEVDFTTRAVAAGARIIEDRQLMNLHHSAPSGRVDYEYQADAARLYVTFKRLWWTNRQPIRSVAFAATASAHLVAVAAAARSRYRLGLAIRAIATAANRIRLERGLK